MAQKSTTRKTLKSLFSRREVSVDEPVEQKDKNEGEKKVFKFLKFKTKKNDPVKPANENQQLLLSAAEPSNTAEAGESWADNISADKKRSSLYGTAPRSKDKGLSYSELDLRKPKRFATFSFGFRKRKKNDEENISKSTVGLHRSGIEEQEETPPDLSQMELDQANTKTRFSMSQPELDTSDTFDIPSPPPMATNQSESYSTLPNQSQSSEAVNAQPEAAEPQTNGSGLADLYEEPQKAPLATIPELQLDHSDSSEEKENYLVHDDSNASASTTRTETTSAVNNQTVPSLPASQPPTVLDTSDRKAAVVDFVSTSNGPIKDDIPQQSDTKARIALTESTRVALSHPEPDAPDVADGTTQNGKLSLASVDSEIDGISTSNGPIVDVVLQQSDTKAEIALTKSTRVALSHHEPDAPDVADGTTQNSKLSLASVNSEIDSAITESTPVPHAYDTALNSASVHQEVSISRTERSTPKSAESVTTTSAVSAEKSARPVNQASVYGALYDSLFPQSFTSDVVSSLSNPPPQIRTETRHLNTKSEPVMVLNERHTDTNALYSRFTSYQTPTASEPQRDPDIYHRYLPSSLNSGSEAADGDKILDSELTRSLSEVKPDSFSLIKDNAGSVPAVQSSAPPASDDAPSQGEDTQVTDSKRRAILVKESVTDEAGDDPACPSPVPAKMSEEKRIQIRIDTSETFFAPSGQTAEPLSPAYLSVGSDDVEVYYSAEEDNAEESGVEVIHTVDEREESRVVDGAKEAGLREEFLQQVEVAETEIRMRNEGECRGVIVKMQSEGGKMGNEDRREDLNSRIEVEQQAGGQRSVVQEFKTSEFLVGNDAESQEKEVATTALPEVEEEVKEERKGEEYQGVIVKMQSEGGKMGDAEEKEDLNSRIEVEQQAGGQRSVVQEFKTSEFLVGNDAKSQEKVVPLPQLKEEAEKTRKEGEYRGVIVKMQNEVGKMGDAEEYEDLNSRIEVEQQIGGQRSEVQEFKTSEFLVGNDAESQEKEVATTALPEVKEEAEEERKEGEPVAPVQQVMACVFAPPSSGSHGLGEGSEGNKTKDLETEDPPNGEEQLPSQEILYQTHKATMSSEYVHASSSDTREEVMITPRFREVEEQVSPTAEADQIGEASKETSSSTAASVVTDPSAGAEVVTGSLTRSAEPQSDAAEIEHNRARQSSEWVDTITQSTGKTRTTHEQVAVELSAPTADARSPDPEAAETQAERHEHPAEAQPDLDQGSLATSRTPTAASEVLASINQPPEADKESVDKMNSGYSSLSTKLSLKNSSPPKEDESKSRFRKVSLISETNAAEACQGAVDFSKTSTTVSESNGTDIASEYKWRNRFEGVSQYRPYQIENPSISDSPSYRMSDTYSSTTSFSSSSSSSALPEVSAYKHLSSSSLSSSPPEEHITLSNRLSDMTKVYQSHESEPAEAPRTEWRRSLLDREEPAAPAGEREAQREAEAERLESRWDSHQLPVSGFSSAQHQSSRETIYSFQEGDDDDSRFTGVFKATLVELVSEPAALPSTPPASPDADSPIQFDMDSLVDTLKNMGPSLRPRSSSLRGPPPVLMSSLAPIVEDAASPVTPDMPPASITSHTKKMEVIGNPPESLKGLYTLPGDLGLKRSSVRDTRSPLELMKQGQQDHQQQPGTRGLTLPLRTSANNSFIMRTFSDSSPEELKSPVLNGNGLLPSPNAGSRLDNSIIFGSHRSTSIDQTLENGKAHRLLLRTGSLPDTGFSNDRMSVGLKELGEKGAGTEPAMSRFERFSFLLNSSPGSLTGSEDPNARMSRSPLMSMGSPPSSNSPTRLLSPTGSIDLQRPFTTTDSPLSMFGQSQGMGMGMGMGMGTGMGMGMGMGTGVLGTPILQRSFSSEGTMGLQQNSMFNSVRGGSQFQSQEVEHERSLVSKYRAFPDAYLTKEKEHGKLNPRPGKMYIFDRPEMCGQRIEVRSDVIDATPWELQETISIRVVRGGWVMYEKPNFKGEKIALDEGDIELTCPFSPPEEEEQQLQNGQKEAGEQNGVQNGETSDEQTETIKPARKTVIGSIRRAVRDYSVPEISLFPEENAEGKKVIFRDTSEDARIFGFPIKANSIIINAGLWLVYAHPFFQGIPRVLEVGGYTNPAAWGVEQPYVGSVHPLKVGEPRVENMSEPKMMLYEKPYFTGKSRIITTNTRDFMTRADRQQTAFMHNVGSLKVQGGMWVGYEKEGFRGHQYLLEEGEYHDWRVWGGRDAELRSVRVIRADLTEPMMVMFEQPEEEGIEEENTFEVTEAIADVELFEYKTSTRSIHVLSGAWIAYSHVDYSGNQYILEKGFYNNCADWGSQDTRICSVQPVLLAPSENSRSRNEIILYSEPDFQGECHVFDRNQEGVPEKLLTKSCRVSGGSWVLYENKQYSGDLYVLSDGDYPNLTSMGCPPKCTIGSFKVVPLTFSVPSISLFGLECLEGREITMDTEIPSMVEEGFNNHILSVRVNSGCWVICEHSNYRGRQFLLEPIEITNWPKFSSIQTIGSMFPVRQKRRFLRIKNKESGHFMSIQGGVEEMKSGRVVASPEVEPMSDIWFYQDGFIKSKLSPTMSLQVMANIEPAAKVVLWQETRQPIQTWTAQMRGLITSLTFPGCVLDVKGGKTYDKDHVVIMPENDERPSQQWAIELL
ncbi:uncharacterized protein crybg2 [Sebastes fasciatus]|uniref:uncharacterized protein crybg2 n=1 Tax=Sebastes fasciatus TaxID=394691 RepID=UPI003D9F4BCB